MARFVLALLTAALVVVPFAASAGGSTTAPSDNAVAAAVLPSAAYGELAPGLDVVPSASGVQDDAAVLLARQEPRVAAAVNSGFRFGFRVAYGDGCGMGTSDFLGPPPLPGGYLMVSSGVYVFHSSAGPRTITASPGRASPSAVKRADAPAYFSVRGVGTRALGIRRDVFGTSRPRAETMVLFAHDKYLGIVDAVAADETDHGDEVRAWARLFDQRLRAAAAGKLHESPPSIPVFDSLQAGRLADQAALQVSDLPAGWSAQGPGVKFSIEDLAATSAGGVGRTAQSFLQTSQVRQLNSAVILMPTRLTADCVFRHLSDQFTGDVYFTTERDHQISGLPNLEITSVDRGEVVVDPSGVFVPIVFHGSRGRTLYDEIVVVRKGNAIALFSYLSLGPLPDNFEIDVGNEVLSRLPD